MLSFAPLTPFIIVLKPSIKKGIYRGSFIGLIICMFVFLCSVRGPRLIEAVDVKTISLTLAVVFIIINIYFRRYKDE